MEKASWHNSHFDMREEGGAYFGYWAIEAAAAVYLLELDDRSFRDHIVYPKDLVDYARKLDDQIAPMFIELEKMRVEDGNSALRQGACGSSSLGLE